MSAVARRFSFHVDQDVTLDVEDVLRENPEEAATIIAVVDEVRGDYSLCERLIEEGHEDDQVKSVKQFAALQRSGFNAYTVRLCEVDHWRLITAVDHQQRIIALLYVMRRNEDYDETVQKRVIAAYEKLGLKQLGRQ